MTSNLIKNEQRKVFPNLTCIWRLIVKITKLNFQSNEEYLIKQNNFAIKFEALRRQNILQTVHVCTAYNRDRRLIMI